MAYSGDSYDEYSYRPRPQTKKERLAAANPLGTPETTTVAAEQAKPQIQAFSYEAPKYQGKKKAKYNIPQVPSFYVSPFVYPSGEDVFEDPSYQFRLQEGLKAMERSAAARGALRSGNTLQDLMKYGQDYASQEYGKAADRAAQQYGLNFGASQAMYAPQFAQWQARTAAEIAAEDDANRRAWEEYQFRLNDQFRREQMLYSGGLGTYGGY